MTSDIQTEIADGVMTVRFNRPGKKNAITHEMYAGLAQALRAADTDRNVRVVILTGNGDSFTAGNDLKEFLENPPTDSSFPVFQFMTALSTFRKPVIAAVNGLAIGIGVTLLLHCDFVYAAPGVQFQLPFVGLALVPEFGATLLLARHVGARKAAELMMHGDPFTAEAALADGLINEIVPADELVAKVMKNAKALAAKPPGALRQTKSLIRADMDEINARIAAENKIVAERLATPELKEAIKAFYEQRLPDFSKFD